MERFLESGTTETRPGRVLMLGTFGLKPKGTMSARAAGIAAALEDRGWRARIATVPWDSPDDAGARGTIDRIEFANTRFVHPAMWPVAVAELVREAHRFRPDLIHLFKPKGFGDLAARVLRRRGYPVVVDMDDWEGSGGWNDVLPYSRLQRRVFDWQERTWPPMADLVTVASRALQQRAIELGASPDRVCYLPNGLTQSRFTELTNPTRIPTRKHSPLDSESPKILLYTRFVEFDPAFVVDVLQRVMAIRSNARLIVAGGSSDGVAESRLESAARHAGLADRIDMLGWIASEDLGRIASRCDVALVPFDDTRINRAKCSVKLLELMACRIPIVASAVGENREYLREYPGSMLARSGDASSHAAGIQTLLGLTESSGQSATPTNAGQRELERYTWGHLTECLAQRYSQIVDIS